MSSLFKETLLNIMLPPACFSCKSEGSYICEQCFEALKKYSFFVCPACKAREPDGKLALKCRKESGLNRFLGAPLPYSEEPVKKLMRSFKYAYVKGLSVPLSQILVDFLDENDFSGIISGLEAKTIMVPVPLYNFRERERGFNQAAEIARHIAARYGLEMAASSLKKIKNTGPQAEIMTKEERLKNVSGAFLTRDPQKISDKIVILVDDVYTSGATMRECSAALRQAGARQVWGTSVAR